MDNGVQWTPLNGRQLNPFDFGLVPGTGTTAAVQTANTTALNDAVQSLGNQGGTILFPSGFTFEFNGTINLDGTYGVRLVGTGQVSYQGANPNLRYTGAAGPCKGATSACGFISARSTGGLELRDLYIQYTNSSFTGDLINLDSSTGADAISFAMDGCTLSGYRPNFSTTPVAYSAHSLVRLNQTIVSSIRNSHFLLSDYGIIGRDGSYSISIDVRGNSFNWQNVSGIRNADERWLIEGNTFEPRLDGTAGAYSHEKAGSPNENQTFFAHGVSFINNWFGDASSGTWVSVRGLAFNFIGNRITQSSGINVELLGGTQGANISGNRFEGGTSLAFRPSSDGMGYHYGVSITGNDFYGAAPSGLSDVLQINMMGNSGSAGPLVKDQGGLDFSLGTVNNVLHLDGAGVTIGAGGTAVYRHLSAAAQWDPPSLSSGQTTSVTIGVPYAIIGDTVAVGFSQAVPAGVLLTGAVTGQAPGIVTVTLTNLSGATQDLSLGSIRADVWQH